MNNIISIRVDKKDLINNLRALSDNYITLVIDTNDLKSLSLKDRMHFNTLQTRQ